MATRRYLHLPEKYKSYETLNPSVALAQTRQKLLQIYQEKANSTMDFHGSTMGGHGSREAALELQNFFQALKQYGAYGTVSNDLLEVVEMDTIQMVANSLKNGRAKKIFQTVYFGKRAGQKQGKAFENQLAQTLAVVQQMAADHDISNRKAINLNANAMNIGTTGRAGSSLNNLDGMIDDIAKENVRQASNAMNDLFKVSKKNRTPIVKTTVEAKTDISGLMCDWNITCTATPYLQRIATLLSRANFTAKSYRSMYSQMVNGVRQMMDKEFATLRFKIGDTDMNRVMSDIFTSAGYPQVVSYALIMALNKRAKYTQEVKEDLAAIRFIYELTGRGQQYTNETIQKLITDNGENVAEADYLIFNDPSTNEIYVRSTADIIMDIQQEMSQVFASKLHLSRQKIFGAR